MELDGRLISVFLGAIVDGHIVKVDISLAVHEISRLLIEICNEELAAPRMIIIWSPTSFISIGCDVDVAAEEEDFATHVDSSVAVCSRKSGTEMIACQCLGQRDDARARIIAVNYGGLTVVDLDISGWKTKLIILPIHEPGVLVHFDLGIAWLCRLYQASQPRSLLSKHVEGASHDEVLV